MIIRYDGMVPFWLCSLATWTYIFRAGPNLIDIPVKTSFLDISSNALPSISWNTRDKGLVWTTYSRCWLESRRKLLKKTWCADLNVNPIPGSLFFASLAKGGRAWSWVSMRMCKWQLCCFFLLRISAFYSVLVWAGKLCVNGSVNGKSFENALMWVSLS